eukprot:RCo038689
MTTSLVRAIQAGDLQQVKHCIEVEKADVNEPDPNDRRVPVHWAISMGREEIFNYLLTYDPDLNAEDESGYTPLMSACAGGRMPFVEALLCRGTAAGLGEEDFREAHPRV